MHSGPMSLTVLDNFEADLLKLLDECAEDLPHAANGRPVASGDAYADDVLKSIRGGKSKEVRRLLSVLLAYIRRGNDKTRARARLFAQRLDAILAGYNRNDQPRPIRILNRRETREDGMLDLAQLRLEADPDDLGSLELLVRQAAFYQCALTELIEEAQDRIVVLRSAPPSRHLSLVRADS